MAVFPLSAGSIDISGVATVLVGTGDSLVFDISTANYAQYAVGLGLPSDPAGVSFELISSVSNTPPPFAAWLQSFNGSASEALGQPVSWTSGLFSSSTFSGDVSLLEDSFELTPGTSQQIFGGAGAELVLGNLGPAFMLGLPSTTMSQDLFVSLSGGPLQVGAMNGPVRLQQSPAEVPEPHSGALLIAGGLILCLAGRAFSEYNSPLAER